MAGGMRKLGAAFVEIFADKSRLESDMKSVRSEVEGATKEMSSEAKKTASSMSEIGQELKNTTKPARELLQGILSIRAVFFAIVGIIASIAAGIGAVVAATKAWKDAIFGSREELEKFHAAINASDERAKSVRENIRAMQAELAALSGASPNFLDESGVRSAEDRLAKLREEMAQFKATSDDAATSFGGFWSRQFGLFNDEAARAQATLRTMSDEESDLLKQISVAGQLAQARAADAAKKAQEAHDKELARIAEQAEKEKQVADAKAQREADQAAAESERRDREHAARMAAIERENEQAMRLQQQFWSNLQRQFGGLRGLTKLNELPKVIRDLQGRV